MQIISDIAQANLSLREYLASRFAYTVNLKQNSTWEYLAIPYIQLRSSIKGSSCDIRSVYDSYGDTSA